MANVVAVYESAEEARAAMTLLERKGMDGIDIDLTGPAGLTSHLPITNDEQRHADEDTVSSLERRLGPGIVIGVLLLGGIGLAVGWAIGGSSAGLMTGIGGAAAGLMLGFFYGGASGLPANPSVADTFAAGANDGGEAWVEVHTDGDVNEVLDALRGTNPRDLRVE